MILPIQLKADWGAIALRKQNIINQSNKQENRTRIAHNYKTGDHVLLERPGIINKMSRPCTGPYEVLQVHTNGTLTLKKGVFTHKVNIRRVTPYFNANPSGST